MTYVTFTDGAGSNFTNGGAPGISAAFLNGVRTFLLPGWFDSLITSDTAGGLQPVSLKPTSAVSIAGTTAGTATVYQFLQGAVKAFILYYNGYRNSTATEQRISLPTPFTSNALFITAGIPATSLWASGSLIGSQFQIVTALPVGTGAGGTTSASRVNGFSMGNFTLAFDQVGLGVSEGSASTALAFFIGI